MRRLLMLALMLGMSTASVAFGGSTLTVVDDTTNNCYVITAHDATVTDYKYWEVKVDKQSGGLFSFKDLTDAGDGQGDHTNYMGASGYNRSCSLLSFDGRGGNAFTRASALTGLADRLTFTTASDNSSFTITYTEDAQSTDFFHDDYGTDLDPGDLLTTITVVIKPPTSDETRWDWTIETKNVSGGSMTGKVWAAEWVFGYVEDDVNATLDSDGTRADGDWDAQSPESYMRWTVPSNTLGLTQGREIIIDYQDGLSGESSGGTITSGAWAGFDYGKYAAAFSYSGMDLADGQTRTNAGQVIVDIAEDQLGPTLTVVDDTTNDCYVVTAHDAQDTSEEYWEVKVDKQSGGLFSFKDLTDAGDGQGDHTNYMGASGYNRSCSLLSFDGRGGNAFTRASALTGLADRLTFTTASDNSSFTITYTEDAQSTDFFHDDYGTDLDPGDLLTTITVVIKPPTSDETRWDWTIETKNVSGGSMTGKVWAAEWVFGYVEDDVNATLDSDGTRADGDWDAQSPESYMRWTVPSNTLGLTQGREIIIDYQDGLSGESSGGTITSGAWAGFDYGKYAAAFSYSGMDLADGQTRTNAGQVIVDIGTDAAPPPSNVAPTAVAGTDQTVHDSDGNGSESVSLDGSGSSDSDGTIASYVWKEGTTQIATGATPSVSLSTGVHTLTLTVTDDDDATGTDTVEITVNIPPTADAGTDQTVHDSDGNGSESVSLSGGNSSDSDGTIASYVWKEGTTQIATGVTPSVSLSTGSHTLTLTVTDDDGGTDTDTVDVLVNAPPVADAGSDQTLADYDGDGSVSVSVDGSNSSDSDGTISSWAWKEGTTELATGETASLTLDVGVHTITLLVTDNSGATHTDQITVTVNAQEQATLSYSYGTTNTTYHYRPLTITATHDSADVWEMTLWVPESGYDQTGHTYWLAGEISSFKDIQHGGTAFEYSPEAGSTASPGLMKMSGMQGDFDDTGGQATSYYEFTKTYDIATDVTAVLTVRINAPMMGNGDFKTTIDGTYTITNNSGSSYTLWGTGMTAGSGSLAVDDGGFSTWSIVNPTTATSKPNSHVTDSSDGHQLYEIYDWYGSTTISDTPGFYTKVVVKNNTNTSSANMRSGLTFELRADDMDYYYVDTSNTMKGSTSVSSGNGVQMKLSNQAGVFGNGATVDDGASVTLDWEGIISTWPTYIPPIAKAGSDIDVIDTDGGGNETVTLDGTDSFDPDGSITSYTWTEGTTTLATTASADVDFDVGLHTVTLTIVDDDGETDTDEVIIDVRGKDGYTYYVDYDNGADTNSGRSTLAPFKHSPGDDNATGIADSTSLTQGDTVIFKGGVVYRGEINCLWSGASGNPIVYDGNTAGTFGTGRAILDGSEELTGWTQCTSASECDGNTNYANIYWTYLPAGVTTYSANLYEDDNLVWVAQHPNQTDPFWFDDIDNYLTFDSATSTTIVDSDYFTMAGTDYWDGYTYIIIWAGANEVFPQRVTGYDPTTNTISYDTLGVNHYDPGKYAMSNSLKILDTAGEYVVREDQTDANGGAKVYLWPLTSGVSGKTFTVSVRQNVIEIQDESYITITGFRIQKAGSGLGQSGGAGSAIRNTGGASYRYDITIQDNELTMNKSMEKQPVISLSDIDNCLIDNNHIWENVRSRGMILSDCRYSSIANNLVEKNGGTAIDYYGALYSDIVGNTVRESYGVHANGITVYLNSDDVFIGGNIVTDSNIAFTCQASDNLTLAYNVFETNSGIYCVAVWNDCDSVEFYNNVIMNTGTPGSGISIGSTNNTNIVAKNNIIDGSNLQYRGFTTQYNGYTSLMWTQTSGSLSTGEFEATKSNLFTDAANDDFSLKSGSDAIDAGVDVGYDKDIEGTSVPQGGDPDVGAYEYVAP